MKTPDVGQPPASRPRIALGACLSVLMFLTVGTASADVEPVSIQLVKDINPGPGGSEASDVTSAGNVTFFRAHDGKTGLELWRTDGTEPGTVLVKDINLGSAGSNPQSLVDVGGTLFFVATDGVNGRELWKSDGTQAGTMMVKDINPGSEDSVAFGERTFVAVGRTLYFIADDGANGRELWRSDGTAGGTVMVKDIFPGPFSGAAFATAAGSTLFFRGNDGTGSELWKSDGSATGTVMVKDIDPLPEVPLVRSSPINHFTAVGEAIFFVAEGDDGGGLELWRSDGTEAGTGRVEDINPGSAGSYPERLHAIGGKLYFSAEDASHGREPWVSDGTAAGTFMLKDIHPSSEEGGAGSQPWAFAQLANQVYFGADDGRAHGSELWTTDGTPAGTTMVKDLLPGAHGSYVSELTRCGDQLFFTANPPVPGAVVLWSSDGTGPGTVPVEGTYAPGWLAAVGDTLYFNSQSSSTSDTGYELWKAECPVSVPPRK